MKWPNQVVHDPSDLAAARAMADREDIYPVGLFYRRPDAQRYDEATIRGLGMTPREKVAALDGLLNRFQV